MATRNTITTKQVMLKKVERDLSRLFEQQQRGDRKSRRNYESLLTKFRELRDELRIYTNHPAALEEDDTCSGYDYSM